MTPPAVRSCPWCGTSSCLCDSAAPGLRVGSPDDPPRVRADLTLAQASDAISAYRTGVVQVPADTRPSRPHREYHGRAPCAPEEAQRAQARIDLGYRVDGDDQRAAGARPEVC